MKKIITNILFILFTFSLKAQINLDSLQVIAAKNNPGLKAVFYKYQADLQQVDINSALPDPQIMFSYALLPTQKQMGDWDYQVSASQMFPWFGTIKENKKLATAQAQSAYNTFLDQKNKLFTDVAVAYYQLYALNKTINIYEQQLKLLKAMRSIANTSYENAQTTLADVLSADMVISERENEIENLKSHHHHFMHEIFALTDTVITNISFPDSLEMNKLTIPMHTMNDSVIFQNNKRLAAFDEQMKAWDAQQKLAKKSGLPNFSIGAEYMGMHGMNDMMMLPMVGVSIPLHRKRYKAMADKAQLMQVSVSNQKKSLRDDMMAQLAMLQVEFNNEKRNVALYTHLINLSQKAEQILLQSYSNGKSSFDAVLQMEQRTLKYSLAKIQAQINLETNYYKIQYLTR